MNLLSDTTKSTEARLETSLSVVGVRAVTKARSTFGTLYAKQSRTRGTGLMYVNMYHSPRAWSWGGDGEGPQATESPYLDHKALAEVIYTYQAA